MINNIAMNNMATNDVPMTIIAQLGEVTVFQTSALQTSAFKNRTLATTNRDIAPQNSQRMTQAEQTNYGELNLGLHVNDNAAQVLNNRMRLLTAINEQLATQQCLAIKCLHWVNQVHGKQIHNIEATTLNMRPAAADAMVSLQPDIGLAIMTADCVPIVLYQPTSGQIAAIHAGWQGLACGVIKATAERFNEAGKIMAWIGVCISQSNYEVGSQVRDQLLAGCAENQNLTASSLDNFDQLYCIAADAANNERLDETGVKSYEQAIVSADKVKLDLPKLAYDQLVAADIKVCTDLPVGCSYGDENYYSYRRQTHLRQPDTGRMALVIVRSSAV